MAMMNAAQVRKAGSLEVVRVPVPEPGAGQVRIRVQACGVCHSDAFVFHAAFPGVTLPRIPGHEVAGLVDKLGPGVEGWSVDQRVGVGWHGGHCGRCPSCRRGDFVTCSQQKICGISYDGGYAEYMVAPIEALVAVPAELDAVAAGPLLCAGITVFNALRNAGARPPQLVAVLGVGGLGHLAIQFATRMGYRTVALARGRDKEVLARQLGAHHYIDTSSQNPAEELLRLGGARVVLATATSAAAMNAVVGGLSIDGRLLVLGVDSEALSIPPLALIGARRSVQGWPSGTPVDSEDTLNFSALTGVRAMVETYPLSRAPEAFARMMSGAARFRVVITPDHESP
jgi:D-arabinose 1-dehydrogenase-like Zn-dependent alcohol dehydrogenase